MSDTGPSDSNGGSFGHLGEEHVPSKPKDETDKGTKLEEETDNSDYESPSSLGVAAENVGDSLDSSLVLVTPKTPVKEDPKPEEEIVKGTLEADNFDSKFESTYSLLDAEENDSLVPSREETSEKEDSKPKEETVKDILKGNFEQGVAEEKDGNINVSLVPSTEETPKKEDPKLEEETDKGDLKAENSEYATKEKDGDNVKVFSVLPEKEDLKTDKVSEDERADSSDPIPSDGSLLTQNELAQKEKDLEEKIKREQEWRQEKAKCLAESIEERKNKRKQCTELSSIKTWPEYYRLLKKEYDIAEPDFPDISNKISIWQGDITSLLVDAIVNAANETLMGGGGVDGAIHRAAGPFLKKECKTFNGCSVGKAVITGGYNLPAKYVIHTVGPRGEKPHELSQCYLNSLQCLIDENQRSIAFPCISTGIFGYPNNKAAEVVAQTLGYWLEENHEKVDRVIFCIFLDQDLYEYEQNLQTYFHMTGARPVDITPELSSDEDIRNEEESDEPNPLPVPVETNFNPSSTENAEDETVSLLHTEKPKTRSKFWNLFACCYNSENPVNV